MSSDRLTLYVRASDKRMFKAFAKKRRMSLSSIVTQLLNQYIANEGFEYEDKKNKK